MQEIPRLSQSCDALTSAERWRAICSRDTTINTFVYAVITTKIYCRPSCAARLARRANVKFYDSSTQAETAGFRPCKRCRPQTGRTAVQNNPQVEMVKKACKALQEQVAAGLKPKLQDLAAQAGLTPSHFHRVFKKHMGVTPGHFTSGLVDRRRSGKSSLEPRTPANLSRPETPRYDSMGGGREGALKLDINEVAFPTTGLSAVGEEFSPMRMDYMWNDFDVLLTTEQDLALSEKSRVIDPRVLSATDGCGMHETGLQMN